ncbi:MAG: hypothetical protein B7Z55_17800 [Planctomycetales bacterium 12-60-4]|nr:MAG: hypothetical protein B7Z55_17800 [Planctomycetales bacterium 12-60-4]
MVFSGLDFNQRDTRPTMTEFPPTTRRSAWSLPDDVTYLNHGSFGPTPRPVQAIRESWSARLAAQPMDFFLRQMEPALDEAAGRLAGFLDADPRDLVFTDNATTAMNTVAATVPLASGDEATFSTHCLPPSPRGRS